MFADIEELIPHRAPMRFIDALTDCTDTTATATACFRADHFGVTDGAVLEAALVECVAQTAAAALGQRERNQGQSGAAADGMMVAVSNFQIQSRPPAEIQLQITIRERRRLGRLFMIFGEIFCAGGLVASGELTLYA